MHPNAVGGQPANTYYGRKTEGIRSQGAPAPSGMPTVTDRRCRDHTADGGRCTGYKARNTDFCQGHLRKRGEA